jgi:hypothetical protein
MQTDEWPDQGDMRVVGQTMSDDPVGPAWPGDALEAGDRQDVPVTFGLAWTDVGL